MSQALALKYRPQTFEDMVGQRLNAVVLAQMVATGTLPFAVVLSGPSGVGKTTAARILAHSLEATDIIEIDGAATGGVDAMRKLLDVVKYAAAGLRVIILDEAQSITRQGFETFLKTLEEPPANNIFILTTTDPNKIPKMIRSRLVEFQFKPISAGDIFERLRYVVEKESIAADDDLLVYIAQRAEGNARTALQSLDMARRAGLQTVDGFRELSGEQDTGPVLMAAMLTGDHARIFSTLDKQLMQSTVDNITASLVSVIRDLFVIKAGGTLEVTGKAFEVRKQLSLRIEQDRLLVAVRVLWEVRTKLAAATDPRGNLELAITLVAEALSRGLATTPRTAVVHSEAPATEAPRKLSLADLQKRT